MQARPGAATLHVHPAAPAVPPPQLPQIRMPQIRPALGDRLTAASTRVCSGPDAVPRAAARQAEKRPRRGPSGQARCVCASHKTVLVMYAVFQASAAEVPPATVLALGEARGSEGAAAELGEEARVEPRGTTGTTRVCKCPQTGPASCSPASVRVLPPPPLLLARSPSFFRWSSRESWDMDGHKRVRLRWT